MSTPARATGSILLLACAMLAAACGHQAPLVVAFGEHIATLDPHLHNHNVTWSVLSSFYDPLVELDGELHPQPALAASWSQVDPVRWRFKLRRGVRFHGGAEFGPEDVVASFDRARGHRLSAIAYQFAGFRAVRAIDAQTIEIVTVRPIPDLLGRLSFLPIVPRTAPVRDEITIPDGTGPYRFVRRWPDGDIEVKAASGWRGTPPIERVTFAVFDDPQVAVRHFLAGEIDVWHLVPDGLIEEVGETPNVRLLSQPRLAVQFLALYPDNATARTRAALLDIRVRRALALALDRSGWVARVFHGNGSAASQFVHPAVFGYDPAIEPLPFDPVRARALLVEAGFSRGFSLTLGHTPTQAPLAEAIAADLARVGVIATLRPANTTELTRLALAGGLSAQLSNWACATGDADDFYGRFVLVPSDLPGVRALASWGIATDPVDRLLAAAADTTDPAQRLALLQRAGRELLAIMPIIPLTLRRGTTALSPRVEVELRFDERLSIAGFRWRQ